MNNDNEVEALKNQIAKLQALYDSSTGRNAYRLGNKLRELKKVLADKLNK